jgi:hypothetical protein
MPMNRVPRAVAARRLASMGLLVGLCQAVPLAAQGLPSASSPAGIYSCIDDKGRRLTSDRPIPECTAREQRVLNKDGSLKTVHPPTLTAEERADYEARERRAAEARAAQADAIRRDRNLMARYPTEAPHQKAREAALDTVRLALKSSEIRLRDLAAERKPLTDEAEFYKGRPLPPKLKAQLDANDAAVDAQRATAANQSAEMARINRLYDAELERLRRLWAGAQPGSLGPVSAPQVQALPAAPVAR